MRVLFSLTFKVLVQELPVEPSRTVYDVESKAEISAFHPVSLIQACLVMNMGMRMWLLHRVPVSYDFF